MIAPRAVSVIWIVDIQFSEEPFHLSHILALLITRLILAFFGHSANLANYLGVAFVVGKPPVMNVGELPDCGEGITESRRDDVSIISKVSASDTEELQRSCTHPCCSIIAILRRDHILCFWSLGRNMDAMPMLFLNPMQ